MKMKISLLLSLLTLGSISESVFIVRHKNIDDFGDSNGTCDSDYRRYATLPIETEGLHVTLTRHKERNLYDIHVTWDVPCPNQFYCTVELTSNDTKTLRTFHNDFGTPTEAMTMFRGVQISDQFNVSIRGWSLLRGDPDNETPKSSTISNETVDPSESDTIISPVAMACMSLVLATGVCSYLAHISV